MTATNILAQRDAVHLLTDGAAIDGESGALLFSAPKAFAMPHVNAALAIRGPSLGVPMLAEMMRGETSYDALKRHAVKSLREAIDSIGVLTAHKWLADNLQMFIVGWSESTNRPDGFTVLAHGTDGLPAWEVIGLPELALSPFDMNGPVHSDIWDAIGGRDPADLDPRRDGLAILEAQRRHRLKQPNGKAVYAVGGFAQLTTVRRDGVHLEILKRWPDVVGRPINPGVEVN